MSIHWQKTGRTAYLYIDRPQRRNSITLDMWRAIPEALDEIEGQDGIRLVIVQSAAPGLFSAGADIHELLEHRDNAGWKAENQAAISDAQHRLARFPIPTAAFVDGDCIGGGCAIALACDIRVASERARFGITPAKLGLVYPFHDMKLLADLVGPGQTKRLLFTGDIIDYHEAARIGLAELISNSPDELRSSIEAVSGSSNISMKQMMRSWLDGQTSENAATKSAFANAFSGEDFIEGTTAFTQKRKPDFRG